MNKQTVFTLSSCKGELIEEFSDCEYDIVREGEQTQYWTKCKYVWKFIVNKYFITMGHNNKLNCLLTTFLLLNAIGKKRCHVGWILWW